jgi:hypothetical protein
MGPHQYKVVEPIIAAIVEGADMVNIVAMRHFATPQTFKIALGKALRAQVVAAILQQVCQECLAITLLKRLAQRRFLRFAAPSILEFDNRDIRQSLSQDLL